MPYTSLERPIEAALYPDEVFFSGLETCPTLSADGYQKCPDHAAMGRGILP